MAAVPTIYHTWSADTIEAAGAQPMALHLAMQALVQNQVDQILKEMHVRRWSDWTHEDLRGQKSSAVQRKKALLLENIPGLLAGPHAAALRHEDWLPSYILSAAIPNSQLREKSHGTSLQVFNIVWEHRYSKALSVTFYNNHLDDGATFDSFVSERLSTNRRSQWALGVGGGGFLRACHYIVGSQQKAQGSMYRLAVAVRVGHSTGEFVYRSTNTGKEEFALRRQDLTPLSFKSVESQSDFAFPFDEHLPKGTPLPSKKSRISAIYNQRFLQGLSERPSHDQVVIEPTHEWSLVKSDEVVVTIYGVGSGSLSPECLFSGVYGLFPLLPNSTWTLPAQGLFTADMIFFLLPPSSGSPLEADADRNLAGVRGRFYYRDFLVPAGPTTSNRLGVNYCGDLLLTARGSSVQTNNDLFTVYRRTVATAIDTAIRTIPELAVEVAYDILTEPHDVADTFGRILSQGVLEAQDDDGKHAYRTAFTKAWRRLDPALPDCQHGVYPYVVGTDAMNCDRVLIERLGMQPLSVAAYVKAALEKVGAYPPIEVYADKLLLSATGTAHIPPGIDMLKECLNTLFPQLSGNPLSVRQYPYSFPCAVWDDEARIFVVSSTSCRCEVHEAGDASGSHLTERPCMCWVAPTLQEAVVSWQKKSAGRRDSADDTARSGLGAHETAKLFHVLYRCYQFPQLVQVVSQEAIMETDDAMDLEYLETSSQGSRSVQSSDPRSPGTAQNSGTSVELVISPSLPPRLARLTPRSVSQAVAGSPPAVTSWWQEGLSDLLRILTTMNRGAQSSAVTMRSEHQKELASLREELAQTQQQLQTVKQESDTRSRQTSAALSQNAVALAEKEDIIQAMEEKVRDRDAALEDCKREALQKDERVRALEEQVPVMQAELHKLRRSRDRFAQLARVIQSLNRDESVDPECIAAAALADESESGPSLKRARFE